MHQTVDLFSVALEVSRGRHSDSIFTLPGAAIALLMGFMPAVVAERVAVFKLAPLADGTTPNSNVLRRA